MRNYLVLCFFPFLFKIVLTHIFNYSLPQPELGNELGVQFYCFQVYFCLIFCQFFQEIRVGVPSCRA